MSSKGYFWMLNKGFNAAAAKCHAQIEEVGENKAKTLADIQHMSKCVTQILMHAKLTRPIEQTDERYRPTMEGREIMSNLTCLKGFEPFEMLMKAAATRDNKKLGAIAKECLNKYANLRQPKPKDEVTKDEPKQESKPKPTKKGNGNGKKGVSPALVKAWISKAGGVENLSPKQMAHAKALGLDKSNGNGNGTSKPKTEPKPQPPVENTKEDKIMNMLQQMQEKMDADRAANEAAYAELSRRING